MPHNTASTAEALRRFARNSRLLALLDGAGIERLAQQGQVQSLRPGQVVLREGARGDSFFLITAGEVQVTVAEAGGHEVARLGPGMFFGEVALLAGSIRSATVTAAESAELVFFRRGPALAILRDYPRLLEVLSQTGLARTEANMVEVIAALEPAREPEPE